MRTELKSGSTAPPVRAAACPVCAAGSTTHAMPYVVRPRHEDDIFRGLSLWSCDACASHFAVPRPAGAALAGYYARAYRGDGRNVAPRTGFPADHPWYLSRGLAVSQLIRAAIDIGPGGHEPLKVLEIGPGYGHTLFALRRVLGVPLDVTAIEPDAGCYQTLRSVATRILDADVMDPHTASALPRPFRIALALHVLEHVTEPDRFLQQLLTWMEPGGVLALEVPHCPPVRVRWYNPETPHVPHLYFFTQSGLTALLARTGFEVESIDTYGPSYDAQGGYDGSFAGQPDEFASQLDSGVVPPLPFPVFAEAGPNRMFLRALARARH